ncbi:MAG: type III-B CRISPR module-associated protein Cmr3 [Nitrospirota bacterium]
MKIFIEPNDVLMFRDGKPFSGGDDHYASGIFPPFPSTFYGAIRSKILSEHPQYERYLRGDIPDDLKEEIGTPSAYGNLAITNFLFARKENEVINPVFPVPKDVIKIKGKEQRDLFILRPNEGLSTQIKTNLPITSLAPLWLKTDEPLEEATGFISLEIMRKYLEGTMQKEIINSNDLFQRDERVGIKKDRIQKAAATGALYSVEYFRLKEDVGFIVELSGVRSLPKEGLMRLGGDHRSVFYKESSFQMPDAEVVKKKVNETGRFKHILLTPAIFNKGWIPDWIDSESGEGRLNDVSLKLVSAAIGKPVYIGGFNLAKKIPKDMKKAVPQGSVYYLEIKQGSAEEILNAFWLQSISAEKQKEGFGISIIGGY